MQSGPADQDDKLQFQPGPGTLQDDFPADQDETANHPGICDVFLADL